MEKSLVNVSKNLIEIVSSEHIGSGLSEIYDRHIETVYRVCLSMLGNKQDAEDVVQTVFLKLLESPPAFVDAEHEKAWLIRTAQNKCRDDLRRWWRKKVVHADFQTWVGADNDAHVDASRQFDLDEKLLKLSPDQRIIVYLYYFEGYKLAEIADLLKLNPNTVKTRMRKARMRLKIEIGVEDDA